MPRVVEPGTVVMIVDDEVDVRESIGDALVLEGYQTHPVASAEAALAQLDGARPSLVILDLWLPGLGSGGFVRRLRASAHARVPVLLISGSGSLEHTEVDADAVLRKPSEMTALVRAVDKLVAADRSGSVTRTKHHARAPHPRSRV